MQTHDLDYIFSDPLFGQTVDVKTGQMQGDAIRGVWATGHKNRALGGHELGTNGPIFLAKSTDVSGLESGDAVDFDGRNYVVSKVMSDGTGLSQIDFVESLDSDIEHGELR